MDLQFHRSRREKSIAAQRRESQAMAMFKFLDSQMKLAMYENVMTTIGLASHARSKSPLKLLSSDVIDQVLAYAGHKKPSSKDVKAANEWRKKQRTLAIVPLAETQSLKEADITHLNLADTSLFRTGAKIVIPLLTPEHHLTQPCWRGKFLMLASIVIAFAIAKTQNHFMPLDLRKYIKGHANWDAKRIEATFLQKIRYAGAIQSSKMYFINAVYSIPISNQRASRKRKLQ